MTISIDSSVIARLSAVDPDRVRGARLAGPNQRGQLLALYAFHMELAKIPELVSEPMIGQIRYQWWRDCLEEIYSGESVRAHEVSTPLAQMVGQSGISRFLLDRIIDGRERDLDPRPFETLDEATEYVDATSGALTRAALAICGSDQGALAGRAWGLTGLARGYRYYADTMLKNIPFGVVLNAADAAYQEASSSPVGKAMPAAAYGALVPGFLKRMRRPSYDPLADVPSYTPLRKQLRMLRAVASGRI